MKITTPRGTIFTVVTAAGKTQARLEWDKTFAFQRSEGFNRVQRFVDNDVLRRTDKYVPLRTGVLKSSGMLGTVIGTGMVRYIAPYARRQYYRTARTRTYDPLRGAYWFERMKNVEGNVILRDAARMAGAKT